MKKFTVMATALTLCYAAAAQAATVTFTLYLGQYAQGPGSFLLTAKSSSDDFGIASYGVQLVDSPTTAAGIETINHSSLRAASLENANGEGAGGFTLLRSADLLLAGANLEAATIAGSQDTTTPTPHLIRGFGQSPGSVATKVAQPVTGTAAEGDNWGNAGKVGPGSTPTAGEFEIARGTYLPASDGGLRFIGQAGAQTFANVFTTADGVGTTEAATSIERIVVVPEPATLAIAGLGMIGCLLAARRRAA